MSRFPSLKGSSQEKERVFRDTLDMLTRARAVLSSPARWTTGRFSHVSDDGAASWCSLGIIDFLTKEDTSANREVCGFGYNVLTWAAERLGYDCIVNLNDKSNHATVLCMFDLAIARMNGLLATRAHKPSHSAAVRFNDETNHETLLRMFDDAIQPLLD